MHYFLVYNKTSGNHRSFTLVRKIKESLVECGHRVFCLSTKYKGHASELTSSIARKYGKRATVIVFGGDGTVSEAVSGLVGTETPLMVIPCGSGNDFAKKLYGRKFTAESVAERLGLLGGDLQYSVKAIDTINANGHSCVNVLSVGFDTIVETKAHKLLRRFPFLGKHAYSLAIVLALFGKRKFEYKVLGKNGENDLMLPEKLAVILLALCNASFYGGGYCPAPESDLSDGILDLVYVDPVSLLKIAQLIGPYSKGEASSFNEVHEFKVTELTIAGICEKVLYNCDGENYLEDSVYIRIVPESLNLCIPT